MSLPPRRPTPIDPASYRRRINQPRATTSTLANTTHAQSARSIECRETHRFHDQPLPCNVRPHHHVTTPTSKDSEPPNDETDRKAGAKGGHTRCAGEVLFYFCLLLTIATAR